MLKAFPELYQLWVPNLQPCNSMLKPFRSYNARGFPTYSLQIESLAAGLGPCLDVLGPLQLTEMPRVASGDVDNLPRAEGDDVGEPLAPAALVHQRGVHHTFAGVAMMPGISSATGTSKAPIAGCTMLNKVRGDLNYIKVRT